jgi:hypothetical protein
MRPCPFRLRALAVVCVSLLPGCGGSDAGPGSGAGGTYTSVGSEGISFELKSGGVVEMNAAGLGSSRGTYTVDGEKIIVSIDNQTHTFIRDGGCIQDQRDLFGKLCLGGQAGEAANVSTRSMPTSGTWVATNEDGTFRLELKPGNTLTFLATPVSGNPDTQEGTYLIEGDQMHVRLAQGVPMVLLYVNGAFESTSFGIPMKFVKQ